MKTVAIGALCAGCLTVSPLLGTADGTSTLREEFAILDPASWTIIPEANWAAKLPQPASWYPGSASRGYRSRVELIRRRMGKAGFLWKVI